MADALKVGDKAAHVAVWLGKPRRLIYETRIVRETKTLWIDDLGTRWRKSDGARVPQYTPDPRYLMPLAEARAKLGGTDG